MMEIRNVTIVGAGTMGHSLAQVFAQEGYSVWLTDIREEILDKARKLIASNLQTLAETGLLEKSRQAPTLKRIQTTTITADACRNTDFVIEAISEDEAAKKDLFHKLDHICPPEAILASNTSYLMLSSKVTRRF